ncbi:glycoside hydrolase family 3 C-terminal domain-containing protein [Candidatus Sumerlaeota bacterium]|nr:glycoside hydrolase family 3 C-terminal domain-containing protein [Candidatus Sumerlaeota bacterium]
MEKKVEEILGQMTLEEKLDYIGGHEGFYIRAIERLNLPAICMADGPMGMRNYGPSTTYPAGIGLAATWNLELAEAFGKAAARDGRARGVHIWLAPGLNIYRLPTCGRNFEYFGEDPYLASRMAVGVVKAAQSGGTLATIKHYACNNQEDGRTIVSTEIDDRTLREIYLPAFQAAIIEGDAACVMNAYNLVNGYWCTENDYLNNKILKEEWDFDGILMSDWGATHHALEAAKYGLDLEMPSGEFMNRKNLMLAIEKGELDEDVIDDKVRRIIRIILRHGFCDRPQKIDSIPLDDPENAKVALQMAREGIVLLKNEKNTLPLDAVKIKTIAVIGPNAHPAVPGGGGSSRVEPFHAVSALDGIKARLGENVEVMYEPGIEVPDVPAMAEESKFEHTTPEGVVKDGLWAEYFKNKGLKGKPARKDSVSKINFNWGEGGPEGVGVDEFSIRFTGRIKPEKDGLYLFSTRSDDGIRVFLDGERILNDWSNHAERIQSVVRELKANRTYDIKIEYYEDKGLAVAQFGWKYQEVGRDSKAVALAGKADVAVVCVGFRPSEESEGSDRSFALLPGHAELIVSVSQVNPRTIVVLNSGGGVAWDGWLEGVPALLHAWYPGQEGGTAIAEILFGDVNPSGKIPASFEKRIEDNPSFPFYYSVEDKTVHYKEGIFVGYRGYDSKGIEPQFCFGHGLSYTAFEYSNMEITPGSVSRGDSVEVTCQVKNTGSREGAEVVQAYVGDVESRHPRPPKELKGFQKVFLKAGEAKRVKITLGPEAFSYFDPDRKAWVVETGRFDVLIGASSRDIRLKGSLDLK